jgi:hypothetical protein
MSARRAGTNQSAWHSHEVEQEKLRHLKLKALLYGFIGGWLAACTILIAFAVFPKVI